MNKFFFKCPSTFNLYNSGVCYSFYAKIVANVKRHSVRPGGEFM